MDIQRELSAALSLIDQLRAQNDSLQNRNSLLLSENESLATSLALSKKNADSLSKSLLQSQTDYESHISKLVAAASDAQKNYELQLKANESLSKSTNSKPLVSAPVRFSDQANEIKELMNAVSFAEVENEKIVERYNGLVERSTREIDTLQQNYEERLNALKDQNRELLERVSRQEAEVLELRSFRKSRADDAELQSTALETLLVTLQSTVDKLEGQLLEKEMLIAAFDGQVLRIKSAAEDNKSILSRRIADLEAEVSSLKLDLSSSKHLVSVLESEKHKNMAELELLRARLSGNELLTSEESVEKQSALNHEVSRLKLLLEEMTSSYYSSEARVQVIQSDSLRAARAAADALAECESKLHRSEQLLVDAERKSREYCVENATLRSHIVPLIRLSPPNLLLMDGTISGVSSTQSAQRSNSSNLIDNPQQEASASSVGISPLGSDALSSTSEIRNTIVFPSSGEDRKTVDDSRKSLENMDPTVVSTSRLSSSFSVSLLSQASSHPLSQQQLAEAVASLQGECSALRRYRTDAHARVQSLTAMNARLTTDAELRGEQLASAQTRVLELQGRVELAEKNAEFAESKVAELERALRDAEKNVFERINGGAGQMHADLVRALQTLDSQRLEAVDSAKAMKKEAHLYKKKYETCKHKIMELYAMYKGVKEELQALQTTVPLLKTVSGSKWSSTP